MEIYKLGLQSYPIFSPLKNHKQLPHDVNEPLYYKTDVKKPAKQNRALE
jgi:hypothetical protein